MTERDQNGRGAGFKEATLYTSGAMVPPVWRRVAPFLYRYRIALYTVTLLFIPALLFAGLASNSGAGTLETPAAVTFCISMFASMTAAGLLIGAFYFQARTTDDGQPPLRSSLTVVVRAGEAAASWAFSAVLLLWFGLAVMFLIPLVNAIRN